MTGGEAGDSSPPDFIRIRIDDWVKLTQQRFDEEQFREKLLEALFDIAGSLNYIADNLPK